MYVYDMKNAWHFFGWQSKPTLEHKQLSMRLESVEAPHQSHYRSLSPSLLISSKKHACYHSEQLNNQFDKKFFVEDKSLFSKLFPNEFTFAAQLQKAKKEKKQVEQEQSITLCLQPNACLCLSLKQGFFLELTVADFLRHIASIRSLAKVSYYPSLLWQPFAKPSYTDNKILCDNDFSVPLLFNFFL